MTALVDYSSETLREAAKVCTAAVRTAAQAMVEATSWDSLVRAHEKATNLANAAQILNAIAEGWDEEEVTA